MSEIFSGFIGFYRFSRSRVLNIIEQKKKKKTVQDYREWDQKSLIF